MSNGDGQFTIPGPIAPISISTPPFVPGAGGPPGAATQPGMPVPGQDPKQVYGKLIEMIQTAMKKRQQMPQPVPAPIPQSNDLPTDLGRGRHTEEAFNAITNVVQKLTTQHAEKKLAMAEAEWNIVIADPNSPAAQAILGDPKKLKDMSEALNQGWLNPKNSPYYQGLHKSLKNHGDKQQAKQGLMGIFKNLIQGKFGQQQQQMTPEQHQGLAKDVMSRAPMGSATPDPKTQMEGVKSILDVMKEQREAQPTQGKPEIKTGGDGNFYAIDPLKPNDAQIVTDKTGKPISAETKGKTEPMHLGNAPPFGISEGGKTLIPGDPGWTPRHQKIFDAAVSSWQAGEDLKEGAADKRERAQWQRFNKSLDAREKEASLKDYLNVKKTLKPFEGIVQTAANVDNYVKSPSGPGDAAMVIAFFQAIKGDKEGGANIRFTVPEQKMITGSRGWIDEAQANIEHGVSGTLFDADQRKILGDIIATAGTHAEQQKNEMLSGIKALKPELYDVLTGPDLPSGANAPKRPPNVPANYIHKDNGPKGPGWYKP